MSILIDTAWQLSTTSDSTPSNGFNHYITPRIDDKTPYRPACCLAPVKLCH